MELKVDRSLIWPLVIKYKYLKKIPDWLSTSFYFAIPALIIFIPLIYRSWDYLMQNEYTLYLKLLFGCIWALCAPIILFKYDEIYRLFWNHVSLIYVKNDIESLVHFYDKQYIKVSKIISIVWCTIVTSVIIIDPRYLQIFDINGWNDPYLYIFIIFIVYLVHLTALGFSFAFITIRIIFFLIRSNSVKLNVYDSDNVGGFSCFGNFSLSTTFLISTGVLIIPILYEYAINSELFTQLLIFLIVMIFGCSIFLVFIVPVALAYKKAEKDKDKLIQDALKEYKKSRLEENNYNELIAYNYMNFLKGVNTYPFNFNTLFKITMTALFPILLYFFQMLLDSGSILYNWKEVLEKIGIN